MTPPVITPLRPVQVAVDRAPDVARAQAVSRRMAESLGFSRRHQWEIATAVSEAATNILKHGREGRLVFLPLEGRRPGLEFTALDRGDGFDDLERARQDGVSEGQDRRLAEHIHAFRGLGAGLGAIERLMDDVYLSNRPGGGALVQARKFLPRKMR